MIPRAFGRWGQFVMRIVGGSLSGRKIDPPLSRVTRPMMDRIREALFNILVHREWGKDIGDLLESDTNVLDAFCGTGALAFEAISWGAGHAVLFDKDREALEIARQNAATLGISDKCHILAADATMPPKAAFSCKLVFLAPPYRKGLISPAFDALDEAGWIASHAIIVAETAKKEAFKPLPGCEEVLHRSYADTTIHFLKR
ncbi:MAG: RsmD family RNA methyltransferase [Alphaproteobacteria bacterium]|nr:RsmD family RNA methyltransferase [Alphaproteobacteria bacterium]